MTMKMKIDWYRFLPLYWLQNEPTDWEWDEILNDLLDRFEPKFGLSEHTVYLGGLEVWVSNYPYCYGYCYTPELRLLPSVATRKRLRAITVDTDRRRVTSKYRHSIETIRRRTSESAPC